MALKHRLSKLVCAWSGHDRVPCTVSVYGTPYYCECCSRCHKVLDRDEALESIGSLPPSPREKS